MLHRGSFQADLYLIQRPLWNVQSANELCGAGTVFHDTPIWYEIFFEGNSECQSSLVACLFSLACLDQNFGEMLLSLFWDAKQI